MNLYKNLLHKSYNQVLKTYLHVRKKFKKGMQIEQSEEWILDNFYVIEEKAKTLLAAKKKFKRLNRRVFVFANDLLEKNNCTITRENIIENFADKQLLNSEIESMIPVLELALIHKISDELAKNVEYEKAIIIGNAITSLKGIAKIDIQKIYEDISEVERILVAGDYDNVYARMTVQTKMAYRRELEHLAGKFKKTSLKIAQDLIDLSKKKHRHLGYFLISTELGDTKGNRKSAARWAYTFSAIFPTIIITSFLGLNYGLLAAIISFIPISEIVLNILNYITTKIAKPCFIPRMDFSLENGGIPDEFATRVVIPAMVESAEQAKKLIKNLEIFSLANNDKNLEFTLICDCKPNLQKTIETSIQVIIVNLNDKYGANKFSLFMRETPWERKRGALLEYAEKVRGKAKYIITLDADTQLNRNVAFELIGAMAHPLNQPKISKSKGRVVFGYGMMQPRIETDVVSANATLFSKIFAGQGGIDSYSFAVSDVYQDLFEEGIFTGKGIFDVETFCRILPNAIKENTVLSHDLLEGSFMRTALLGDVTFVDDFPSSYHSYAKRNHRWIRGDWQLLPYLKCKLSAISKWKIIDNMRRSILPICLTLLVFYSVRWLPLVILVLCSKLLISTIEWATNQGYKTSGKRFHSTVIFGIKGVILQTVFLFVTLLHEAFLSFDAICRTLWRVFVSRKNMLQWTVSSNLELRRAGVLEEFHYMWISCLLGVLLIILKDIPIGIIWILAPILTYYTGIKKIAFKTHISREEEYILKTLARRIWQYFEDFATPKTNFLAPDNYQENPPNGIAMRVSPTNIGMHIMATISAFDLGFINMDKVQETLEKILDAMEEMEKWNGNLYNWYDISNLTPLNPRYVSTVDSGNLLGYLLTAIGALQEYDCKKFEVIIERLEKIADDIKLGPLFETSAGLFYIGYNVEKQEYSDSYYDLLASEVRQTVYIAIARGEIPLKSWSAMGRSLVTNGGYRGLVSWSGSMFEYLMPLLIMPNIPNTLLDETYHFCLREQKLFAKLRNVPIWGTSESGFNSFDNELNYQYKAFGVPKLGVSRGILSDVVIAPYATILALMVDYKSSIENLIKINDSGFCGHYGFYEAIDYTPKRILSGDKNAIVRSFMVHHLGMSLLAINNVLNDNILQKRFMNIPQMATGRELLAERVPTNVIISKESHEKISVLHEHTEEAPILAREFSFDKEAIKYHVISSKKTSITIDSSGKNVYKSGEILFNNEERGNVIKIVGCDLTPNYAIFSPSKAEFICNTENGLDITTTLILASEHSCQLTKMLIANNSDVEKNLEITTSNEIVISPSEDYYAHPAFSKLFTKTWVKDDCCYYEKKGKYAISFAFSEDCAPEIQTNRGAWRGNVKTIDPIAEYTFKCNLHANNKIILFCVNAMAESKDEIEEIAEKYNNEKAFEAEEALSVSRSRVEAKHLNISLMAQEKAYENLDFAIRHFAQSKLWVYGISGDLPIFTHIVRNIIDEEISVLLEMQKFLWAKNIKTDLVFMIEQEGYEQPIFSHVNKIMQETDYVGNVSVLTNLAKNEIELIRRCGREI